MYQFLFNTPDSVDKDNWMPGLYRNSGFISKREDGRYELTEDYEEFGLYHNKPNTVESAIKEIESYVSYLEDMPLEKVRRCEDKIAMLASRLQALKDKMYR